MIHNLLTILITLYFLPFTGTDYKIEAIRYATIPQFPLSSLVIGAPGDEKIDIAMVMWLIRSKDRNILFDCGYYREKWNERFTINDYLRPDKAVQLAGLEADEVTDIIISHAHWDHMGGIDLFPNATIWIQKSEFEYYTGAAWQEGGRHGGIDPEDMLTLVRRNTNGKLRLVNGDDVEIFPGIRVFTGARHTYSSQYILVETDPPYVLASDNCYLYRNLETKSPVATFTPEDGVANVEAQARMIALAGSSERVIPGHDFQQFKRFPGKERIAFIK